MSEGTTPQLTADEQKALDLIGSLAFEHFTDPMPKVLYRVVAKRPGRSDRVEYYDDLNVANANIRLMEQYPSCGCIISNYLRSITE